MENPQELDEQAKARRKGIYLLPNLFTTSALFSGFYAIIAGINGEFVYASIAIFIAMVLDGLDGRVARMTNTESDFGAEYDSLADMISFGLAPALVVYFWALSDLGKVGWVISFVYVVGAALRLARFNTQIGKTDKRFFIGLASPAAAAVIAGFVWVCEKFQVQGADVTWGVAALVAFCGIAMISNIRYYSFKTMAIKKRVPYVLLPVAILIFVAIILQPAVLLLAVFAGYAFSGAIFELWELKNRKNAIDKIENEDQNVQTSELEENTKD
jgi:CDP-diacylglycerol---serine O-phosphatidyltransferase